VQTMTHLSYSDLKEKMLETILNIGYGLLDKASFLSYVHH